MKKMTLTTAVTLATALLIAATSALAADTPATAPAASKITPQSTVLHFKASMEADRPMWQRVLSLGITLTASGWCFK